MYQQIKYGYLAFAVILLLAVNGCGGASRPDDAAPMNDEVSGLPTPAATADAAGQTPPAPPQAKATPTPTTPPPTATPEPPPPPGEAGPVISFQLNGGIVGFCDTLVVNPAGDYVLDSCGETFTGQLEPADLELLQEWAGSLAGFKMNTGDDPNVADRLISELVFNGRGTEQADETRRQIIFDWVNGLLVQTRPQPVAPPTTEPPEVSSGGLCPEVDRPAVVIADYENPSNLILVDLTGQTRCNILLPQPPFGRILTAAGAIYYPVFDPEAETLTIWQVGSNGPPAPLDFTAVPVSAEQFGPYNFALSEDGRKIAWSRTAVLNLETNPPVYQNDIWVADIDGENKAALMEQVKNNEGRYVEFIRFDRDNNLYYALQPDVLSGTLFSFGGRFDNVYRVPAGGGPAELLFACPTPENASCVGDVSADGAYLVYSSPGEGTIRVIDSAGGVVNTLTAPATDFVGPAIFGPGGTLAFISGTLAQTGEGEAALSRPNPGIISLLAPPYTGQPETLLTGSGVAALWEWVDESRLAYGPMDEQGNIGASIVTVGGQTVELSPNFALAVLR